METENNKKTCLRSIHTTRSICQHPQANDDSVAQIPEPSSGGPAACRSALVPVVHSAPRSDKRNVGGACGYDLDSDYFSRNQWSKGVGYSRCRTCVQEGIQSDEDGFSTARTNKATTRCTIDKSSVFADGSFRHVYLGTYTGGDRTGQMCVAKYFHDEFEHLEDDYFERDMNAVQKTLKIVTQWNQNDFISKIIRVNVPQVWQDSRSGSKFLLEPYIEDYQKFNSNSGWVTNGRTFWGRVMQALSHYSYHVSSGQFLLCDLQGGVNHVGAIISDPVIMSHNKRFGVTDLGRQGIINFFHHHRCNKYCQPEWTRPKYTCAYFERRQGTTMIRADYYYDDDDDDTVYTAFTTYWT